jgi:LmbE family N-acetylglucosaminyl deacetylase
MCGRAFATISFHHPTGTLYSLLYERAPHDRINREQARVVIGAHPDDNEFGAGVTSAKLAAQGWNVTFIIVTNGNKGSHDPGISPYQLSEIREQEQRAAAAALGVARVIFLRNNDGELESTFTLRAEIALYIRHFKPHCVLIAWCDLREKLAFGTKAHA